MTRVNYKTVQTPYTASLRHPDMRSASRRIRTSFGSKHFQTISTLRSYSTCSELSIKRTGRRLVLDSGTKCVWVIPKARLNKRMHRTHSPLPPCASVCSSIKICLTTTKKVSGQWPVWNLHERLLSTSCHKEKKW